MVVAVSNQETGRSSLRFGRLWRDADFRKLWAGETVSFFGSQLTALALPLTAAVVLGATPAQMGILGAAQTVPFLLLALFAGIWVDRARRRPVLIAANVGRGVLLGVVPVLTVLGALTLHHLYAIAFLVGGCTVFFELAYQSYLPRLVERHDLVEANSKLTASASVAEIGGPGLAGVLVGVLTAPLAIALDALSFLFSAAALARIRRPEPAPAPREPGGGLWQEIGEGVRETVRNRYLLAFAGEAATYNVFWNAINAILVLYAIDELGMSAGTLGLVLSVGSVGALLGALLTGRCALRFGVGNTIVAASVLGAVSTLLIPAAGDAAVGSVALLGLAFFVRGVGVTGCNVHVYAIRQAITPDRLLGRTNAVYRLLTYGFIPLGALLGGFLGEAVGLRSALLAGAIGVSCSWLWLFFSPARQVRALSSIAEAS